MSKETNLDINISFFIHKERKDVFCKCQGWGRRRNILKIVRDTFLKMIYMCKDNCGDKMLVFPLSMLDFSQLFNFKTRKKKNWPNKMRMCTSFFSQENILITYLSSSTTILQTSAKKGGKDIKVEEKRPE